MATCSQIALREGDGLGNSEDGSPEEQGGKMQKKTGLQLKFMSSHPEPKVPTGTTGQAVKQTAAWGSPDPADNQEPGRVVFQVMAWCCMQWSTGDYVPLTPQRAQAQKPVKGGRT